MIPSMMDSRQQPATDLLAEFRKKFVTLADRSTAELRAFIDDHRDEGQSNELRDAYDEHDSLRYFEQELHRVIQAFVIEAVTPWQKVVIGGFNYGPSVFDMPRKTSGCESPQGPPENLNPEVPMVAD